MIEVFMNKGASALARVIAILRRDGAFRTGAAESPD
jgi:hypothetical protein